MTPSAFIAPTGFSLRHGVLGGGTEHWKLREQRLVILPNRYRPRVCAAAPSVETRTCVRCGATFLPSENAPGSCRYHGDILGNVQTLNLYEDHHFDDPALSEVKGPRYGRRWACCQETDPDAPPCKSGVHVTYDCPPERWTEGLKFEGR